MPKPVPAREAMKHRTRVTFGKAYVRDVVAGVQTDFDKQFSHAVALGLGSPSKLKKLAPETLREKLAEKIKEVPAEEQPTSSEFVPFPEQ